MNIEFYTHSQQFTFWPVLLLVEGEHEDTGEPGGIMIMVDFMFWGVGISFTWANHG